MQIEPGTHSRTFPGAPNVIECLGDTIWDMLCDDIRAPYFTTKIATQVIMRRLGYSEVTARQYVRAVLRNVEAQDGGGIRRIGNKWLWA